MFCELSYLQMNLRAFIVSIYWLMYSQGISWENIYPFTTEGIAYGYREGGEIILWVQVIEFSRQLLRQVMERRVVLEVTGNMRMVELQVPVQQNLVMTYLPNAKHMVAKCFPLALWSRFCRGTKEINCPKYIENRLANISKLLTHSDYMCEKGWSILIADAKAA